MERTIETLKSMQKKPKKKQSLPANGVTCAMVRKARTCNVGKVTWGTRWAVFKCSRSGHVTEDQIVLCGSKRKNELPSGALARQNGPSRFPLSGKREAEGGHLLLAAS